MNIKKIIFICLLLVLISSISVVSASDSSLNDQLLNSNQTYSDDSYVSSVGGACLGDSYVSSVGGACLGDSYVSSVGGAYLDDARDAIGGNVFDSERSMVSGMGSDALINSNLNSNSNYNGAGLENDIQGPNLNTSFKDIEINYTESNTIYVNGSYSGSSEDGTVNSPYKTVNLAFNRMTSAKSNVFIANGIYDLSSAVTLSYSGKRTINIIGENSLNTVLNAKSGANIFSIKGSSLTVNLINLTFSKGYDYYGGAVYINHSEVNIINSIFKNNTGIDYSSYYVNYTGMGGAVYAESAKLNIYNSQFCNNLAKGSEDVYGGAIYNFLGDLSVYNSSFINNSVNGKYGSGGAIYNYGGFFTLINSSLVNNTINSNYSLGGAIVNWNGRNIHIINSSLSGNEISGIYTMGSALANKATYLYMENVIIANNSAKGMDFENNTIYNINGIFDFSNITFENNTQNETVENLLLCLEDQSIISSAFEEDDFSEILSELNLTAMPSSYDLRDENLVTYVQDQGSSGSCWAFAALASLESHLLKYENVSYDFSENNFKNIMSYYSVNGTDWDDGGNYLMALAYLLRWSGPVDEDLDPFNDYSTRSAYNLTVSKHVQDALFIPLRMAFTDNIQIKLALLKYGALYTTIYSGSYMTYHTNYYMDSPEFSNHAITLVGWDDNFKASNFGSDAPPGDGAFIIKNSWGDSYGDDGYWYISYYDNTFAG